MGWVSIRCHDPQVQGGGHRGMPQTVVSAIRGRREAGIVFISILQILEYQDGVGGGPGLGHTLETELENVALPLCPLYIPYK